MAETNYIRQTIIQRIREAVAIIIAATGIYLLIALFSYYPHDPSWANTYAVTETQNLGGLIGAWIAQTLNFVFGYAAFLFVAIIFFSAYLLSQAQKSKDNYFVGDITRWIGYCLITITFCGLLTIHFKTGAMPASAGGWVGEMTARGFINIFGDIGTTLLLLALLIGSLHLITSISWLNIIDNTGAGIIKTSQSFVNLIYWFRDRKVRNQILKQRRVIVTEKQKKFNKRGKKNMRIQPTVGELKASSRAEREKQIPLFADENSADLPPLAILADGDSGKGAHFSEQSLEAIATQLEIKLADFKVEGKVVKVQTGPVVTRFELSLAPGTKARQVTVLEKDLARALSVSSVRVVEVIPGKAVIGIEIPNEVRETVLLRDILNSEIYDKNNLPLNIVLGKDVAGKPIIINLQQLPHLLIAGTTGSGKSVAVHAMLMSILFKSLPQAVRFILIDPKMLEMNAYEGIPHLLLPVVTDMKESAHALRWAVAEMDRRYEMMLEMGVRNLEAYNHKIKQLQKEGKAASGSGGENKRALEFMAYIVIVIDEFADIMMVVGKPVEELITRLAQKARAAGIHLIVATQRPSVDVITGLIKANIPSRIALQVSSKVDSRTILDQNGAEQLLGQGDMLYLGPGQSVPERIHGAFVSDQEVKDTVKHWRKQGQLDYVDLAAFVQDHSGSANTGERDSAEADPLYDEAVAMVIETGKTSISYLQRRLRIGYNRAAGMIEQMESAGIVSAVQANGKREILVATSPEG